MPCPAHRYDTLLSACIYIGAIEPSARVPDTNLSLPYTPSRSASLPLRSSHTLAYNYLHRPWLRCVRQHHHPHRPPSPCRFVGAAAAVPQCRCTVDSHQCRSDADRCGVVACQSHPRGQTHLTILAVPQILSHYAGRDVAAHSIAQPIATWSAGAHHCARAPGPPPPP